MINALTIDFEDWFCANNLSSIIKYDKWNECELRITENTKRLLEILDNKNIKATFFVLGWIAERVPELVKIIDELGHEIASHGYSHISISNLNKVDFDEDLKRAVRIKKEILDKEIIGYRSPSFSITKNTLWAFKILEKNGFKYDSSVFPLTYHPDYGISSAPLSVYSTSEGIKELPLSCYKFAGIRVPFAGGAYFRFYPLPLSKMFMKLCNKQNRPFVFYLHPWEIDMEQPRINVPFFKRVRHYYNLKNTFNKLEIILSSFNFTSIRSLLNL